MGIADDAGQCRYPEPVTYRNDLRLAVRDSEGNPGGANLTLAGPVGDAMNADDDPPDGIRRARAPCGKAIAGDGDAAEQIRPLPAVKVERWGFSILSASYRNVGSSLGQSFPFARTPAFHS